MFNHFLASGIGLAGELVVVRPFQTLPAVFWVGNAPKIVLACGKRYARMTVIFACDGKEKLRFYETLLSVGDKEIEISLHDQLFFSSLVRGLGLSSLGSI